MEHRYSPSAAPDYKQAIFNTRKDKLFESIINDIARLYQPEHFYLYRHQPNFSILIIGKEGR
jgi:hypothetical protein